MSERSRDTAAVMPGGPEEKWIAPGFTLSSVEEKIEGIVLTKKTPLPWMVAFLISLVLMGVLFIAVSYLFMKGIGIWGNRIPVAWAFDITNFVWWIGIGHAGTLISAILLLMHQQWRNSINRFAEAMTLFAVTCAGLFPLIHVGRPWVIYWVFPYPNSMGVWPQFRSPLLWDVVAVSTYGTISFLFWFIGLIPDLASMRDRAKNKLIQFFYGMLAMGWRGSARHWQRYESAYLLLAGLATPLVVSVHTVVSFDFSVSLVPGWHSTVFPPYFVAGAIYSGFAMVVTLAIPLRKVYGLNGLITDRHLDNMAKIMLTTGLIVAYGYLMEIFTGWYSANIYEMSIIRHRMTGPYAPYFWALILLNVVIPQILWFKKVRSSTAALFILSIVINVGMWLERFIIIVTSLAQDFLPSAWRIFTPTIWDWATLAGSIGLFIFCFTLFIRVMPMISIFESKDLLLKGEERP